MKDATHSAVNLAPRKQVSIRAPVKDATCRSSRIFRFFCSFYPRAREGRDMTERDHILQSLVSIRAPVKDATIRKPESVVHIPVSIRAPVKDAT